ncbi:MAG: hypothetical protein M3162_02525 [Thermoproteota archaeon]|nr:hypothetical protein [Thermoproteota archaeon]
MSNDQQKPNDTIYYKNSKDKTICSGLGCVNPAVQYLKLAVIKTYCGFCSTCTKSLEKDGLVISKIAIPLGIGQGDFVKVNIQEHKIEGKGKGKIDDFS